MNASLLKINYVPLLIIAGIAFGSISIVKIFYFVKVVINRYRKDEKVIPN